MQKTTVTQLVRVALLTALAAVLTCFPQIPNGAGGYVHFGDSVIYLASIFFGPAAGAFAGGVGHALADGLSGYTAFVAPTFLIKGLMGFVIGKIAYQKIDVPHFAAAGAAALVIVTGGYFAAEWLMFGLGTATVSLVSSPIQWLMSVAASAVLLPLFMKIKKYIGL